MSDFVLRVPAPARSTWDRRMEDRLHEAEDERPFGDETSIRRLQEIDEDHELILTGRVLSLRIPVVEPAAAPAVFALAWYQNASVDATPDPDGRIRCTVRRFGGALYAPYGLDGRRFLPDIDQPLFANEDILRATAFDMFEHGIELFDGNLFLQPHVGGYRPSPEIADPPAVGLDLFRGRTPVEAAIRSAADDFALIGGRLHRRVGDPVLVAGTADNGAERRLRMRLPIIPEYDALRRFRHDRAHEAEIFFAPRDGFVRVGRLIAIDPGYGSQRDDALLSAIDMGRILLRATSKFLRQRDRMTAPLTRAWADLRDDLVELEAGRLDPFGFLDRGEAYADLCAHPTEGLRADSESQSRAANAVARTRKLAARRRPLLPARRGDGA